jgi:hypothetical protein
MSLHHSALASRYIITPSNQRPADTAFGYFVKFYGPKRNGAVSLFWTSSRESAERFAAGRTCYGRPAVVQRREEWAAGRSIGFSAHQAVVK